MCPITCTPGWKQLGDAKVTERGHELARDRVPPKQHVVRLHVTMKQHVALKGPSTALVAELQSVTHIQQDLKSDIQAKQVRVRPLMAVGGASSADTELEHTKAASTVRGAVVGGSR
jgi:hypothetical protein